MPEFSNRKFINMENAGGRIDMVTILILNIVGAATFYSLNINRKYILPRAILKITGIVEVFFKVTVLVILSDPPIDKDCA